MNHTNLSLEAELGCSHLLSTMETASSKVYCESATPQIKDL